VSEVDAQFNFDRSGTALPDGAAVKRRFAQNAYEFYGQLEDKAEPHAHFRTSIFSVLASVGDERPASIADHELE
jgi:hypothetical protein